MTDQEKNEVLARWAGFQKCDCGEEHQGCGKWWEPDGDVVGLVVLSDFLHSLDAQAKWLWPKLTDANLEIRPGWARALVAIETATYRYQSDSPAEACAEAILSLIGEDE